MRRFDPLGEDRDYLAMRRAGASFRDIAAAFGTSYRTVYLGVARAMQAEVPAAKKEDRLPKIDPAFGSSCKPLRLLTCDDVHPRGPLPRGSKSFCPVCHQAPDVDHLPTIRDVRPLPRDRPAPALTNGTTRPTLTRRERRAVLARGVHRLVG